tara:strand:+ start:186 stop:551 length:366 start_codon:yes stop_codon:yes gene_type:complete
MQDKEQIILNKQETIKKLSILMMISDRDIHDDEYKRVIEIIEEHSLYDIKEDKISDLVSEVSFEREQKGIENFTKELATKLKSKSSQKITLEYLEDIMSRDGYEHEEEKRFLKLLRKIWNI